MSIDDLLAKVRKRSPKVGYATVYRTMKLLTDSGIAAARQFGDGQTRYEVMGDGHGHHDHLICTNCGLILEFENDTIEQLQDEMADRLGGFKLVRHKLELYGLCPQGGRRQERLLPQRVVVGERPDPVVPLRPLTIVLHFGTLVVN